MPRVLAAKDRYEYYRELSRFAALLQDGHTDVSFPADILQDPAYYSMLPVMLGRFGEDIAVINVTEEYRNSIGLYSILKKIDGTDASVYVREKIYPYIWHAHEEACGLFAMAGLMCGRAGSSITCTFEKDGKQSDIVLTRENPADLHWCNMDYSVKSDEKKRTVLKGDTYGIEMTEDGIAVIRLASFGDHAMPGRVYECFDELKKAKAYVIDVRANVGGSSGNADAIAALFIDGPFLSCAGETQVYEPQYKAWSVFREDLKALSPDELERRHPDEDSIKMYKMSRHVYYRRSDGETVTAHAPGRLDGPVAILMNAYTFSAAEDFVDVMKAYTDAVFIGTNTAGSSGQPLCRSLESGGAFRICTRRCLAQNGEDIYNKGFSPDIEITGTVSDLAERRDRTMEKALAHLRSASR